MWDEDRVRLALEAGEDIGSEVIDRADEVFVPHEHVGEDESEEDCADPGTYETFGTSQHELHGKVRVCVPSTVFFGLSLISCVLPNVIPQM